jgi:hypothetical protein
VSSGRTETSRVLGVSDNISLALETRKKQSIVNSYYRGKSEAGDKLRITRFLEQFPNVKHRPVGPSRAYNCHGLTFGSRRTGINLPEEVNKIIDDDGYRRLDISERLFPGDIAIYVKENEISHSGLVVWVTDQHTPWILSKWGIYHEAVHMPLDCPYHDCVVIYYRLER